MNSKRWNLFAVIFLFLLACEAEPQDERPVLTPTPVESVLPTITPVHSEITVLAEGVVQAAEKTGITVPVVIRMEGTNVEKGRQILAESGLNLITAVDLKDAAQKVAEIVA